MTANEAFYYQHDAVRFTVGIARYRAFEIDGQIRVFSESSQAESFSPAAFDFAQQLLAAR